MCLARKLWKRQAPLDRDIVRAYFGQQRLHSLPEAEGGQQLEGTVGLLQMQLQFALPQVTAAEEEAMARIWERNGKDDRRFVEHMRGCTNSSHVCARAWEATENASPGITLSMWYQQHPQCR